MNGDTRPVCVPRWPLCPGSSGRKNERRLRWGFKERKSIEIIILDWCPKHKKSTHMKVTCPFFWCGGTQRREAYFLSRLSECVIAEQAGSLEVPLTALNEPIRLPRGESIENCKNHPQVTDKFSLVQLNQTNNLLLLYSISNSITCVWIDRGHHEAFKGCPTDVHFDRFRFERENIHSIVAVTRGHHNIRRLVEATVGAWLNSKVHD